MSPRPGSLRPRVRRPLLRAAALLATSLVGALAVPATATAEEAGTTVVGELVHVLAEGEPGAAHIEDGGTRLSWVQTEDGAVRVDPEQVATVPAGAEVSLTVGAAVADGVSGNGGGAHPVLAGEVVTAPAETEPTRSPRTGLTNEVTVVLVAPAGTTPDGTRLADVVAAVDGPVADFWAEQTGGAISLGVTKAWDWVSTSARCEAPEAMWAEVAAAVGFAPGPGKHLVVRLSGRAAAQQECGYALAQVGTGPASGGRLYVRETLPSVIAHELGHNFGLGHSSAEQCDGVVEGGSCRTAAYRDLYDVMGASWAQTGALNAVQAAALGALPADAQETITTQDGPRTVSLAPLAGGAGVRALRLVGADGMAYWLELRSGTGRDGWLTTSDNAYRLDAGVLLHRAGRFPDTSLLLDGTPSTTAGWEADLQAALPLGAPVAIAGGEFTVSVRALDGGAAVVDVVPGAGSVADLGGGAAVGPADAVGTDRPGATLPGTSAAAPEAVATPQPPLYWAPEGVVSVPRTGVALEPVADSSGPLGRLLLPAAGSVLTGATLLLVRALRRKVPRRR